MTEEDLLEKVKVAIAEEYSKYKAIGKEVSLIDFLRVKCVQGNEKLYKAYEQMKDLSGDARKETNEKYDEALKKLDIYCDLLKALGFYDCLYIDENGKKTKGCLRNDQPNWFCRVCPSQKRYWEDEIMA